jgi:membrane associated rhomboid family serine protease
MGIYDRDYYREPQPRRQWGNFSPVSVTTWLIAINVLVFIVDAFLRHRMLQQYADLPRAYRVYAARFVVGPLERWGYFSLTTAITHLQLWRFLTFQFLHANLGHLFSNMLGLYFFGPIVESYFGARRYIAFYLFCGSAGAATYLLLLMAGMLQGPDVPLVGASAGIFGVLIAGAMIAPNITVMLLFPPIPIKFKYLALGLVAYATYVAVTNGENAGGQAAHIGGAVLGFVFMRYPILLRPFGPGSHARARRRATTWSNDFDR